MKTSRCHFVDLTHPHRLCAGSFRRWRIMNQIRKDKFDLVLPEVMRENHIDMWIIMCREGNFDPMYPELGEGYVGHNGYYIFTDTGKPRIERAVLGVEGYLLEETGAYDYFGSESELKDFVSKRDPKKIGLNMSKDIGGADGLSYTGRQELAELLGKKYESRFVSAEKLYSDYHSRHVRSRITAFVSWESLLPTRNAFEQQGDHTVSPQQGRCRLVVEGATVSE